MTTTLKNRIQALYRASFIRFAMVGVANTIVGSGTAFLLLNLFGLTENISGAIGTVLGAFMSYFLNRSFTFRNREKIWKTFPRFALVIAVCYTVSYLLIGEYLMSYIFRTEHAWVLSAKAQANISLAVDSVIYVVTNYFGQKLIAFRK